MPPALPPSAPAPAPAASPELHYTTRWPPWERRAPPPDPAVPRHAPDACFDAAWCGGAPAPAPRTPPPPPPPYTADYIVTAQLPHWPRVALIYYPNGCIHVVCGTEGQGMVAVAKTAAADPVRIGVLAGPAVTQRMADAAAGDISYFHSGGTPLALVAAPAPARDGVCGAPEPPADDDEVWRVRRAPRASAS